MKHIRIVDKWFGNIIETDTKNYRKALAVIQDLHDIPLTKSIDMIVDIHVNGVYEDDLIKAYLVEGDWRK